MIFADLSAMTITQAQEYLNAVSAQWLVARDQVDVARRRIHEFSPLTKDYDFALRALTLDEIESEFYAAAARTNDPDGFAARWNMPVSQVAEWASMGGGAGNTVWRMVCERDGRVTSFAMPFGVGKEEAAGKLMDRFRETQVRHGWAVSLFGPAVQAETTDTMLAEA